MMNYGDTFIKGVTYGEAEELWDVARTAGFIAFLEEFKTLADKYAEMRLEDFINDHFPDDTVSRPKPTTASDWGSPEWLDAIIERVRSYPDIPETSSVSPTPSIHNVGTHPIQASITATNSF